MARDNGALCSIERRGNELTDNQIDDADGHAGENDTIENANGDADQCTRTEEKNNENSTRGSHVV